MGAAVTNFLSVDLEDYLHAESLAGVVRGEWGRWPSRLEGATERLLALLAEAGVRATFFCLGWAAERHPWLVRRIASQGHEIASHGYSHRPLWELEPDSFRQEVRRSKRLLEDISGQEVIGYRAPTFSVVHQTLWALSVLAEEGYRYDSSIFPVRHDRYGIPRAPRFIHRRDGLWEIPPATVRLLGTNVPVAGGGYLRLLPFGFLRWALRRINRREGHPFVLYVHPWELDPDQPRLPVGGLNALRHYRGLDRAEERLRRLLGEFRFQPLREVLGWR